MRSFSLIISSLMAFSGFASTPVMDITGPNGLLNVKVELNDGTPTYTVDYNGKVMLESSPLGVVTSIADLSKNLKLANTDFSVISDTYTIDRAKKSTVNYSANEGVLTFVNPENETLKVVFRVSDNDVAFRYELPAGKKRYCVIERENTGFDFPSYATTYITPQSLPMVGWENTKPSYEEEYTINEPIGTKSSNGVGYTFPALFKIGEDGWALVSETGVDSKYAGTRLGESSPEGLYMVEFPQPGENNGVGTEKVAIHLPGVTSWKTITVGETLKPIVESTVAFDVVEQKYEPSQKYVPGKGTWSWIVWQDASCNFDDQKTFMDLAADMKFEYILIDALWDNQIGYDRMPELIRYAQSKGVDVWLWYNSNGHWNNAPQGPLGKMDTAPARNKEMAWMQENGVKGIKVDFFGGDKQETMKLYEDILTDANKYGLMVDFHGCTLPRGWERMYPNYFGSEAVLASENLIFSQYHADKQVLNSTILPFTRNAVGAMEYGPVFLTKRLNKEEGKGTIRKSTDAYELASAVLYFSPIQFFGVVPKDLQEQPQYVLDFLSNVPTTWDDTKLVDGKIGEYVVMARQNGDDWYLCATNATKQTKKLDVVVPEFAGKEITLIYDNKDRSAATKSVKVKKDGKLKLELLPDGGAVAFVK